MKKANPSSANGRPKTEPNSPISRGQSRPISKERIVPETAPTAKSTPATFAQVRARRIASASPWMPRHSAMRISAGNPTPRQAKTMCQPSDSPI